MLETEEVDDDFFTPVAGTSLANIFGSVSNNKETTENDSLKYVPPKPQNIIPKKKEQVKATECVFACALIGHEWCNNIYTTRGKLGFAIVKIQKTGDHNIVLYDSNKTTLSSTTISTKLEVTIKNNTYISYYDSLHKYWSVYGTEEDINKIGAVLKSLEVNVNYSTYVDKGPLEPNKPEIVTNPTLEEDRQINMESDTDSSSNRKTKASILNRMANMGQSVLPTRTLPALRSSDSSDTNEIETMPKAVRHKPAKASVKKNNVENMVSEPHHLPEGQQRIIATTKIPENNVAIYNRQLMPLTNTSVIASTSNEFSMFMSEQRISNSELRININRVTDKMDLVLDKINNLEDKNKNSNVPTDITLKLLTEYENKIKIYEELLKSKGNDDKNIIKDGSNKDDEVKVLKAKISKIEKEYENKCNEITNLKKEIQLLKDKHSQDDKNQAGRENELLTKINTLEDNLIMKNKELTDLTNSIPTNVNNNNIADKVKNIMNDTFQTISMNFDSGDNYTGETIKRIVGTVIKKITIRTLSEL